MDLDVLEVLKDGSKRCQIGGEVTKNMAKLWYTRGPFVDVDCKKIEIANVSLDELRELAVSTSPDGVLDLSDMTERTGELMNSYVKLEKEGKIEYVPLCHIIMDGIAYEMHKMNGGDESSRVEFRIEFKEIAGSDKEVKDYLFIFCLEIIANLCGLLNAMPKKT